MAKPRNPIQTLIAETLAARNRDVDAVAEICRQAFAKMVDGKPIPAELQSRYNRLSPTISLQQRLDALRTYFHRNIARPEPLPVAQPASATIPPLPTSQPSYNPSSLGPHDRPLPPLPPEPERDGPEERLRMGRARAEFRRLTALLSWKDKGGSGGSGGSDGTSWMGN